MLANSGILAHMLRRIVKNSKSISSTKLRKDALAILESGLAAVNTKKVIKNSIKLNQDKLSIGRKIYNLKKYNRIFVIGIGKTSFDTASQLEKILGKRINGGIVLDVKGGRLKYIKSLIGSHPLPSMQNMRATGEIMGILKSLDSRDLVITIISGGGSTLLCWPYELKCENISAITDILMKKGANIHEINTVRKHLSEIQGGQFARLAYPATVAGLIFSDVPGDDLSMVASGPTVLDTTSAGDAAKILKKYSILKSCKLPTCNLKETPKDPKLFEHVYNHLVVSNIHATKAMQKKALELGYKASIYSTTINGEARKIGQRLAKLPKSGEVIIAAGETTVTVKGKGKGGRNQELALGALENLKEDTLVLSCASDGIDNTSVAGALVDQNVKEKASELKLNPQTYLKRNNSFEFFQKTNSHLKTGITGSNVSDLMIAIRKKD